MSVALFKAIQYAAQIEVYYKFLSEVYLLIVRSLSI
jgi:hypothetical protein